MQVIGESCLPACFPSVFSLLFFLKKKNLLWNIQPSPNIAHSCHTCNVLNSLNIYLYFLSLHHMFGKKCCCHHFFPSSLNNFQVPTIPCYQICQNVYLFLSFGCSSKWFHVPLQSTTVRQLDLNYHTILTDKEVTI